MKTATSNKIWGKRPDTNKIRLFLFFMYCIDAMVMNFLVAFLNQAAADMNWSATMSSLALGIMPFAAVVGTVLLSLVSNNERKNLNILRICMGTMFVLIILLGVLGAVVPNGIDANEKVKDEAAYYGTFVIFLILSSLINGLEWGMQPVSQSIIADINNREGTKFGNTYCVATLVYIFASPLGGLIAQSLAEGYIGYLWMFLCISPAALLAGLSTFFIKPKKKENGSLEKPNEKDGIKDTFQVFKNGRFVYYLLFTVIFTGLFFTFDSVMNSVWTNMIPSGDSSTPFTPLNWGIITAIGCIFEFIFLNISAHFNSAKSRKGLLIIGASALSLRALATAIITVFYYKAFTPEWIAYVFMALGSLRGVGWGTFSGVNVPSIEAILGPKMRQKGVFMIPLCYQTVSGIMQFIYPQVTRIESGKYSFTIFFVIMALAMVSAVGYFFMKNPKEEK